MENEAEISVIWIKHPIYFGPMMSEIFLIFSFFFLCGFFLSARIAFHSNCYVPTFVNFHMKRRLIVCGAAPIVARLLGPLFLIAPIWYFQFHYHNFVCVIASKE